MRVVKVGETLDSQRSSDGVTSQTASPEPQSAPDAAPQLRLVLITWHDAWFDSDQQSPDEWRSDYLVHTVGFLVRQDAHIVSIAQELLPDGDGFRAVTHIPVSTIEDIIPLYREGPGGHILAPELRQDRRRPEGGDVR